MGRTMAVAKQPTIIQDTTNWKPIITQAAEPKDAPQARRRARQVQPDVGVASILNDRLG